MLDERDVEASETRFFQALQDGNADELRAALTPDFLLVDVLSGSEVPAALLVELVGSGQLRFDAVNRIGSRVRCHGDAAIVTGETRMRGRFGEQAWDAHSRYTHVHVATAEGVKLASAQGTPIADAE